MVEGAVLCLDEIEKMTWDGFTKNLRSQLRGLADGGRGLIQTYPWFIMAFAGLHTLQEMTHNY